MAAAGSGAARRRPSRRGRNSAPNEARSRPTRRGLHAPAPSAVREQAGNGSPRRDRNQMGRQHDRALTRVAGRVSCAHGPATTGLAATGLAATDRGWLARLEEANGGEDSRQGG